MLCWLRLNIERMVRANAIELTQLVHLSEKMDKLVSAFNGIDKIDKLILPLPYCQLLKIFELFFVFTLPFVIVGALHAWVIPVSIAVAVGFFGLDQVHSVSRGGCLSYSV